MTMHLPSARGPPRRFQPLGKFTNEEETMTTEHHDLWAELPEWENEHDPGQVLD